MFSRIEKAFLAGIALGVGVFAGGAYAAFKSDTLDILVKNPTPELARFYDIGRELIDMRREITDNRCGEPVLRENPNCIYLNRESAYLSEEYTLLYLRPGVRERMEQNENLRRIVKEKGQGMIKTGLAIALLSVLGFKAVEEKRSKDP
ncbi:hypothetical protein HYY71_02355 [Candidatus Woesearchaeota archaeon]|nr:hypothetical protein [Candidatus Woesearchaeota archaeon]